MSNEKAKRLLARRKELIDEMAALSHALYGTWYERFSTCSRPNCRCHQGELHGPRYYVVVNRAGRQIQKYIPIGQKDEVLSKRVLIDVFRYRIGARFFAAAGLDF